MSEELQCTLSLRGASKSEVESAVAWVESVGYGAAMAAALVPPPVGFDQADGHSEGPATWYFDNWGCRGFDLKSGMWWEEYDVGTPDEAHWACWNLVTIS